MEGFSIPHYTITQDSEHVYITITTHNPTGVPNIAVEGRIFGFHLEPYYLPLVIPDQVTRPASDAETIRQDGSKFRVTLKKMKSGKQFYGLDTLQPQLLPEDELKQAIKDAEEQKGLFQPAESEDEAAKLLLQQALKSQGLVTVNDDHGEAAIDNASVQQGNVALQSAQGRSSFGFGFRGGFTGELIPGGCADTKHVLEVSDPDAVEPAQREQAAYRYEEQRWDEGVYMDNYLDVDGELAQALAFKPTIPAATLSTNAEPSTETNLDIEAMTLIVQLLFALSYDERTNQGEPTVESGWTIAKLCRCLAACVPAKTTNSSIRSLEAAVAWTLVGCVRRALTVPLYRHWELSVACMHDTLERIQAGSAHIINSLEQVAARLKQGQDPILCRLCQVWLEPLLAQPLDQAQLNQLDTVISNVMRKGDAVTKHTVGGENWDLEVLEQAAKQAYEDGEGGFV
ncbi:uncharacterized protein MEPE_05049 [Melanopsichium pennsylvanicum]|uniref:Shq1 protein domain-containing protein n=2 Tax=Melanopsichium pennsylvanicum TaxID=63383 RepID=A0AAJ5C6Y2_9BASI|nr:conserved hypothetical protein [Melanopsichium pennsylvanicum 4]SNX86340.1 uncharacterized protein MEPE_05049 [Melanopsichium pennsylvanicum]